MRGFTESVVEDAALGWLEALGYAVLHGPQRQSIGAIIGSFKSATTKHIHNMPRTALRTG